MQLLLIALAGAVGALARYGIGVAAGPQPYPWATLGINVAGSFLLGGLLTVAPRLPEPLSVALAVGLLGAFTTFSTFSAETLVLLRTGHIVAAMSYATASVVLGLAGAAFGYWLLRTMTSS